MRGAAQLQFRGQFRGLAVRAVDQGQSPGAKVIDEVTGRRVDRVTGAPGGDAANHLPGSYLSVYVPTTPNPTGGYFVMLKSSDCIELRMSVDEALKYVVSMGVVVPVLPGAVPNK